MLDFYVLDLTNIVISGLVSILIYLILDNMDNSSDNKNLNINILSSFGIGILLSIFISYITIESDELLTSNYWE